MKGDFAQLTSCVLLSPSKEWAEHLAEETRMQREGQRLAGTGDVVTHRHHEIW
jgi:hypothetical protein